MPNKTPLRAPFACRLQGRGQGGQTARRVSALVAELALLLFWVGAFIWVPVAMALGRVGTDLVKRDPRWKRSQPRPSAVEVRTPGPPA